MARTDQKRFYRETYDRYGVSAQGVAWDSVQTQKKRFAVIRSCLGDIQRDTLVDAGCGFGDFYLYLQEKNSLPQTYIGLDLSVPMVEEARVRTACKIMQKDILRHNIPMADWYVASGSMNLLTRVETSVFIRRCFEKSRKGFVFNLLQGRESDEVYSCWQPHEMIALCQPLGGKVEIKEGYMEGDFTVILRA